MKLWKLLLGLGAACAACCAFPVLGVTAGLGASVAGLVACAGDFAPALAVAAITMAGVVAARLWQRHRHATRCACAPATGADHAR